MANIRTMAIFRQLLKTNKRAAFEYLGGAFRREQIDKDAAEVNPQIYIDGAADAK